MHCCEELLPFADKALLDNSKQRTHIKMLVVTNFYGRLAPQKCLCSHMQPPYWGRLADKIKVCGENKTSFAAIYRAHRN